MSTNHYNGSSDSQDSTKEQSLSQQPPQNGYGAPSAQSNPVPPQQPYAERGAYPPPYHGQRAPGQHESSATSAAVQTEDKSSRAGVIGATTGGLTAHFLGGGILSTIGGAMAGAAGAKKISQRKREKKQQKDQL